MIVGVGVDLVDLQRFERTVARTPRLLPRLFTAGERMLADGRARPVRSLAARFAAKEALVKALGEATLGAWSEIEVVSDAHGKPSFLLHGAIAAAAAERGADALHLSLSHDGGLAIAYVVIERRDA